MSFLAVKKLQLPFTDIKSLYYETNYQIALFPGSAMEDSFKYSSDHLYHEVYSNRIQPYLQGFWRPNLIIK